MNVQRFQLLRLPVSCSQNVLRIMSPVELVAFSLNTSKCKNIVKSLKIESEPMLITISSYLEIQVELPGRKLMVLHFYRNNPDYQWETGNHGLKKQLKTPKSVSLKFPSNTMRYIKWDINILSLKEWLEHLQFIFNCSIVIGVRFAEESFNFDIDSVKSTLLNIIQLGCFQTGSHDFTDLILKTFMPVKCTTIEPASFRDSKIPFDLLIQNFYSIWISEPFQRQTHVKLNELLLHNSKGFTVMDLVIHVKELNKFLKLWMKGAAPRLEYLLVDFRHGNDTDRDVLMKGINYQIMPINLRRPFKDLVCHGGMDFYRYDGVKATIHYGRQGDISRFAMYVWFDHCSVIKRKDAEYSLH